MDTPLLNDPVNAEDRSEATSEVLDKPIFQNGRYANPWATWRPTAFSLINLFRFLFLERDYSKIPNQEVIHRIIYMRWRRVCLTNLFVAIGKNVADPSAQFPERPERRQ